MLKARIRFSDLHAPVRVAGGSVFLGESRLTPFAHRLLRARLVRAPSFTALVVYERLVGEPASAEIEEETHGFDGFDALVAAMQSHALDWLVMALGPDRVELACAYQGTAPVHVARRDGVLEVSWDIADLVPEGRVALDAPLLARFVMSRWPYACETMLDGVWRLTSETRIAATADAVRYAYPEPQTGMRPHALAPGADPVAAFFDAVETVLALRPLERESTATELSGGMDSAIATLAVSRVLGAPVLSYGAEFEGEMGVAQRARRMLVSSVAGTRDIAIPAEYFAPYDAGGPRRSPPGVWPEDDSYPELLHACFDLVRKAGIDTVISGLGGDELYPIFAHETERDVQAEAPPGRFVTQRCEALAALPCRPHPQSWLLASCWQTSAGRAAGFLRKGLWPVYPFFSRDVARFTFNLPVEWRRERMLHARVLTRLLGDGVFETDYLGESFRPVMQAGFRRNRDFLRAVLAESALAKLGLVDPRKVLGDDQDDLDPAFFFFNWECFFRGREVYIAA